MYYCYTKTIYGTQCSTNTRFRFNKRSARWHYHTQGWGVRAIMMVSSINLSLKAYDEQQAIIMQFQSF